LVGLTHTIDRSAESGDHYNRRTPWPVALASNVYYTRADFGYYENPEDCQVAVEKTCVVEAPPATPFVCADAKPIDELTMKWIGTATIAEPIKVKAWKGSVGGSTPLLGTVDPVALGDTITITGFAGSPNDVYWELFKAGTDTKLGTSLFHLSCSDADMNGPEDIGKRQGNSKCTSADDCGWVNGWELVAMAGNGLSMTSPAPLPPAEACTVVPAPTPSCATLGKPSKLTFEYRVETCGSSNNPQGGKAVCADPGSLTNPAFILITDKSNPADAGAKRFFSGDVNEGATFDATGAFGADTYYHVFDVQDGTLRQTGKLHTSCSQTLEVGDQFGSLLLTAFNGATGGNLVTYGYKVSNLGQTNLEITEVVDNPLGAIDACEGPLAAGTDKECSVVAQLTPSYEPITNVVDVTAKTTGLTCVAKDQATVSFMGCTVAGENTLTIRDDKVEWRLTNTGSKVVTIDNISLDWPQDHGNLKKIKRDRDEIFSGSVPPPSATITSFSNNLDKRQIKPGETRKLIFEFDAKLPGTTAEEYDITINFDEYCSVTFVPGGGGGTFSCSKPFKTLTMAWNDPNNPNVWVTAYQGTIAAGTPLTTLAPVTNGGTLTVSFNGSPPNDNEWEIFTTADGSTRLGKSVFHVSCSDRDMDSADDCGKAQGDAKAYAGFLNTWILKGMGDSDETLSCP
jgi:hypothetical protein